MLKWAISVPKCNSQLRKELNLHYRLSKFSSSSEGLLKWIITAEQTPREVRRPFSVGYWSSFQWHILKRDDIQMPPLWSNGQSFWLQIQRSRFRLPALPDFMRSSGPGTGSTQPREDNWGDTWKKKSRLRSRKPGLTTVGIRCADHATVAVGIVRSRTKSTEFSLVWNTNR
jgi:hypothetical protein